MLAVSFQVVTFLWEVLVHSFA